MACFIVPAVEAIITTTATKIIEKKEAQISEEKELTGHVKLSEKLKSLNGLLWGGSVLLMFEHVWHGEVVPFAPFLTAAADPAELTEMLHEMRTVGVGMAVAVTLAWGVVTYAVSKVRASKEVQA